MQCYNITLHVGEMIVRACPKYEFYDLSNVNVTSQGERVPRGMGIQYSRTNILGDMSKYMKISDSFILN